MSNLDDSGDEEVGYGKPPRRTRFKKNLSGNPRGRPRKARAPEPFEGYVTPVLDTILKEMARKVTVREGGTRLDLTAFEAVVRRIHVDAIKGKNSAQRTVVAMANAVERHRFDLMERDIRLVTDHQETWNPVFEAAKKAGLPSPNHLPHPSHLNFDVGKCRATLSGPIVREVKAEWEQLKTILHEYDASIDEAISWGAENPGDERYDKMLRLLQKKMANFEKQVPEGWDWREEL